MDGVIRTSLGIDRIWKIVKLRKGIALPSIEIVEESEGRCYDTGNRLTKDLEEVIVIQTTTCFIDNFGEQLLIVNGGCAQEAIMTDYQQRSSSEVIPEINWELVREFTSWKLIEEGKALVSLGELKKILSYCQRIKKWHYEPTQRGTSLELLKLEYSLD